VNHARRIARQLGWAIADGPHPHFPAAKSTKDGWWSYDYWLPRAVARYKWEVEGDPEFAPPPDKYKDTIEPSKGHPWWTVLRTYALRDVERTYPLWAMQKEQLEEQELWELYMVRKANLKASYQMESNGVSVDNKRLKTFITKLAKESADMERKCFKLAGNKIDNLNSPKQLTRVLFGNMGVKPVKLTKKGINSAKAGAARDTTDYSSQAVVVYHI
jgi:hypothetical protein